MSKTLSTSTITEVSKPSTPTDPTESPLAVAQRLFNEAEAAVKADVAGYDKAADEAWEEFEAVRKAEFVARWTRNNWVPVTNPYEGKSLQEIYRITRPAETRLDELLKAGFWREALKVLLYRNYCRLTLSQIKDFFRPWMEVDGSKIVYRKDGVAVFEGVSPALAELLSDKLFQRFPNELAWIAKYDVEEFTPPNQPANIVGSRIRKEYTPVYANELTKFPSEEF